MNILGIWDGTPASACLLVDGKVVSAVVEERLTRNKNEYGFPLKSIETLLAQAKMTTKNIDRVVMSTASLSPKYFFTRRNATFSVKDYWKEQTHYWRPKFYGEAKPDYLELFSHVIEPSKFQYDRSLIANEDDAAGMALARRRHASAHLGVDENSIEFIDHHTCHAYYGQALSPFSDERSLIFTIDGNGDNTNATVSIAEPGRPLEFISRSSNCNIGRIYRYATLLLGMRPADHEYKVMGLAAYNSNRFGNDAYKVYADTLYVDGLSFAYKESVKDHFFYFKERLEGQRFDAIAFGVQKFTEELLEQWVLNGINITGIKNIVMSGGVAQNIKATKRIAELNEVEKFFIPPGPGDESIAIGAVFADQINRTGVTTSPFRDKHAYFGPSFADKEVDDVLGCLDPARYTVQLTDVVAVARLLADGAVVARFGLDPMEFGARALGNRSILADPRRPDAVNHINKLVKMRDFWMPFAPSILEEAAEDYIVNPKRISAKFMAVGFDSTDLAKEHLAAGLHAFDKTMRPQIVSKADNPQYHALIQAFAAETGVGGLLNTSFNIHGEPIVGSPSDAVDTLERCGLEHLYIGDWLVSKII